MLNRFAVNSTLNLFKRLHNATDLKGTSHCDETCYLFRWLMFNSICTFHLYSIDQMGLRSILRVYGITEPKYVLDIMTKCLQISAAKKPKSIWKQSIALQRRSPTLLNLGKSAIGCIRWTSSHFLYIILAIRIANV